MYMRTDEESEAVAALAMVARMAGEVTSDIYAWRWVVLALHNAVQGFMALSLRHGNGFLALSPRCFAAWMDAYENNGEYPREELDTYLNLYKKVKSRDIGSVGGNRPFTPSGSQGRSIRKLNELRNEFIHFTPKGWSLEVTGLPQICMDCLKLVAFLGWETQNIFWHNQECTQLVKESHAVCMECFQTLRDEYDEARS